MDQLSQQAWIISFIDLGIDIYIDKKFSTDFFIAVNLLAFIQSKIMNSYLFCENCQASIGTDDFVICKDNIIGSCCIQRRSMAMPQSKQKEKIINQRCCSCMNRPAQIICSNCSSKYLCTECSEKLHCKGKFTFHSLQNITITNNIGSPKKQLVSKSIIKNRKIMFPSPTRQKIATSPVRSQSILSDELKLRQIRQILSLKKQVLQTQKKQAINSWEQLIYIFHNKFSNLKNQIEEKQQKIIQSLQHKKNFDIQILEVEREKATNLIQYIDNSIILQNKNQIEVQGSRFNKIQNQFQCIQDNYRGPKIFQYSYSIKEVQQITSLIQQLTLKRLTLHQKSPDMKSMVKKSKIFGSSISPKHRHTNSVLTTTSQINQFEEISTIDLNKNKLQYSKQQQKLKLIVLKKGSYGENIEKKKQGKYYLLKQN